VDKEEGVSNFLGNETASWVEGRDIKTSCLRNTRQAENAFDASSVRTRTRPQPSVRRQYQWLFSKHLRKNNVST